MPVISAVLVSYRSGALAARALESLREDAARSGLSLETIAVVNSDDAAEARSLEGAADRVLVPGRNLGYAGGLNAGARAASGEILVLSNPDVLVRPGALAALAGAARERLAAAGPALFLDEGETIHMPPAEEPHPFALARRRLAGTPAAFRRGLRRAAAAAEAAARGETRAVEALSGALVAVSRATLERVGPFDEAYALYYEENDWQRRLRKMGGALRGVGAARVVHAYNSSARLEPRAAAWFAESERRYFATHFGARGSAALDALAAHAPPAPPALAPAPAGEGALRLPRPAAVALSPLADFSSFAFVPRAPAGAWRPPADVVAGFGGAPWYARAVDQVSFEILGEEKIS
ncbi:MAG: glycosyltransferase family 2 protein [Acidobacteria bacterium]|nr:glycosyltransferase family 2 protein [Acidobacteriota bacterium]